MANDRLSLYNHALYLLGERKIASLTENREPRRVLDSVWDDAISYCLEQGQWKFAIRTSKLTYSTDVTPEFGYRRAFEKPSDCVRLTKVCSDEYLMQPLLLYNEEAGWWFADLDNIYISYVSNHANYGADYANWPRTFAEYVAYHLASEACMRITQSDSKEQTIEKKTREALKNALSKDAMQDPTKFLPTGRWVSARRGDRSSRDLGSRSNLIG